MQCNQGTKLTPQHVKPSRSTELNLRAEHAGTTQPHASPQTFSGKRTGERARAQTKSEVKLFQQRELELSFTAAMLTVHLVLRFARQF